MHEAVKITRRDFLRSAAPLAGVAGLLVSMPASAYGQAQEIAVIVHPDVPVDNLTIAELRRILLGDREFWASGMRVALFLRAPVAHERDVAIKDVCQMTEAQFRQHWIAKVFRADTPSGPRIVYSGQMAIDQVSRTPGAITFVEASAVVKGVKVMKIDGKAPGQAGYRVR
jgi:ABC-type phosphate transport system substrate-binding protein